MTLMTIIFPVLSCRLLRPAPFYLHFYELNERRFTMAKRILAKVKAFHNHSFNYLLWMMCVTLIVGCSARVAQIINPTPNFSWEPPSKEAPQNLTIALVRPRFGSDAKFMSYS